jgi:Bacterial protein of unknown function (DUF899)
MVKLEKGYVFDGPHGPQNLKALFGGRRQLIVYHFMFDPAWAKGCSGCTSFIDALGNLSLLNERDTTFVVVSRAPLAKLEAYKALKGWSIAWVSSFGSDFNYDFHVTLDPKVAPAEYNYRNKEEMSRAMGHPVLLEGEEHGLASSSAWTTPSSTLTRPMLAAPNPSQTPIAFSTPQPMAASKPSKTRPPAGPKARPTESPRQRLLTADHRTVLCLAIHILARHHPRLMDRAFSDDIQFGSE